MFHYDYPVNWGEPVVSCNHASMTYNDKKKEINWTAKAVGVDGVTKEEYSQNLKENIRNLVERLKNKAYKPAPSLRVYIPKGNGTMRPLGITVYEDKIVQLGLRKSSRRI